MVYEPVPARRHAGARVAAAVALLLLCCSAIPLAVLAVNVPDLPAVLAFLFARDVLRLGADHPRRVDLAAVNDRVLVNNVSLGLYADVVQSAAYRDAKLGTWRRLLPELLRTPSTDLRFDRPDAGGQAGGTLVPVSNNPYELRRIRVAGTRPRLDTGAAVTLSRRNLQRLVRIAAGR